MSKEQNVQPKEPSCYPTQKEHSNYVFGLKSDINVLTFTANLSNHVMKSGLERNNAIKITVTRKLSYKEIHWAFSNIDLLV